MANANKVLYLLTLLLSATPVFAQVGESALEDFIRQIIPEGYFILAEGFAVPPTGSLVIFLLVWFLSTGIIWIGVQRALGKSYSPSEDKGYVLFAVALGGLMAYGIGLWVGTFTLMLVIVSLMTIGFIALIVWRSLRGAAAGFEKFELELRKQANVVKKDFLNIDKSLKQIELEHKLLNEILSRGAGQLGGLKEGQFRKLLDDLTNFEAFAKKAIHDRNLEDMKIAAAKARALKKELTYIKKILPNKNSELYKLIEKLEKNINTTEKKLEKAIEDELKIIRDSEDYIIRIIVRTEKDLDKIDGKIRHIENEIMNDIRKIKKQLVGKGTIENKELIINNLNDLKNRLENLKKEIIHLEKETEIYEKKLIALEETAKIADKGHIIQHEVEELRGILRKCEDEFKGEYKELKNLTNVLITTIDLLKVNKNREDSIYDIKKNCEGIVKGLNSLESCLKSILRKHRTLKARLSDIYRKLHR